MIHSVCGQVEVSRRGRRAAQLSWVPWEIWVGFRKRGRRKEKEKERKKEKKREKKKERKKKKERGVGVSREEEE